MANPDTKKVYYNSDAMAGSAPENTSCDPFGVCVRSTSSFFLNHGLLLDMELMDSARLAEQQTTGVPCLCPTRAEVASKCTHTFSFLVGAGDQTQMLMVT